MKELTRLQITQINLAASYQSVINNIEALQKPEDEVGKLMHAWMVKFLEEKRDLYLDWATK